MGITVVRFGALPVVSQRGIRWERRVVQVERTSIAARVDRFSKTISAVSEGMDIVLDMFNCGQCIVTGAVLELEAGRLSDGMSTKIRYKLQRHQDSPQCPLRLGTSWVFS